MPRKIEISHRTIVFTSLFLIFIYFLYIIRDIILQFFIALLITAILNPLVSKLSRYKIPRSISVLLVYIILLATVGFSVGAIVPPLAEQTSSFVNNFPRFISNLGISYLVSEQLTQQLIAQLGTLPSQVAKAILSLFSNFLALVAVLVFAFYLLTEREKLDGQLGHFLGEKKRERASKLINNIEKRLGGWATGQLALMFVVGLATYIGLRLLEIPFALPLAILSGLLEIIPYIGPILASIPAVVIGFGISPIIGLASAALYFLVQQLENYVFVPKIMQKQAGVDPIVTLLALAVGFRLAGFVGILISVPVFIMLQVTLQEYLSERA